MLYLPPKRPALLKPRPQRFVLTKLSLYSPALLPPAVGAAARRPVVLELPSMGSSKPYEPSTTMSLSDGARVDVWEAGVFPTLA